ncbi:MAG TPA: competence/damage-inducible protein A [Acidimicrobiia bacterium]|nr:competence/damage-inducible protein A [Acidimicrobiia bacterium]
MIVEVLAVGTELLLGQHVNSNAAEIGRRLAEAGLDHYRQVVVGDNLGRITQALHAAAGRADAVIVTGGLGPTQDDLTRDAMASAAGVEMRFDAVFAERLREFWESRGREMPPSNLRQAEYPDGSVMIRNSKGTAPGLRLRIGDAWVFALPGVPAEMITMLERDVLPFLIREAGGKAGVLVSRVIRTWGESESRVSELLADLYEASTNPTVAFLASAAEIKVRLTARAPSAAEADELLDPLEDEVRRRLGSRVFAVGDRTIEQIVLDLAADRGWSLGTAESVTGGLVAQRITGVAGASATFAGSVVAYAAGVKRDVLGVPAETIEEHGAVSEETAAAMAMGAAEVLGADVVVATTGEAGPDPQERRVGTIVIAVATPEDVRARTIRLPGDRERVRLYGSTAALQSLRLGLTGEWWRA